MGTSNHLMYCIPRVAPGASVLQSLCTHHMTNTHKYIHTHTHDRTGSSGFIGGRGESADSPLGPMKARKGVSTRMSSENLLDSDRPTVPIRASSMEDIHTLGTQPSRSRSGGIPRIVDSVVKLHLPDHTHKYIDISPVSEGRGGGGGA